VLVLLRYYGTRIRKHVLGPVSLEMPHCLVHISVTAFDNSRVSVTDFDCFRVLILGTPSDQYEDRTEAYGQHLGSKDPAGLGGVRLRSEDLDNHSQDQGDSGQASAQVGNRSQVSRANGKRADDIPIRGSNRDSHILEESNCKREGAILMRPYEICCSSQLANLKNALLQCSTRPAGSTRHESFASGFPQ
jgi:hypothetical protein